MSALTTYLRLYAYPILTYGYNQRESLLNYAAIAAVTYAVCKGHGRFFTIWTSLLIVTAQIAFCSTVTSTMCVGINSWWCFYGGLLLYDLRARGLSIREYGYDTLPGSFDDLERNNDKEAIVGVVVCACMFVYYVSLGNTNVMVADTITVVLGFLFGFTGYA